MPVTRIILVVLLCALALGAAGCRKRRVQAAPLPAPTVEKKPLPDEVPPPEIRVPAELPPPPELVVPPPRPAPRPPRRSTPAPAPAPEPEPETTEAKSAAPRMAPRLSPAEQAQYQEKTWQAIALAEKNLQAINGKRLTAAQQDLGGKVRGFLAQAREAIGVGDWARALNLAEKAHVLSKELLASLGL